MSNHPLATTRQLLAVVVTLCVAFGPGFVASGAAQSPSTEIGHGSFRGTLYQADEVTPLVGAKVTAINVRTGKQYSSELTAQSGEYLVDGLPGGTYDLVIEVGGNLFVVDNIIDLSPNESVTHSFAVQPERPASRTISKMADPKGSAIPVGETTPAVSNFWRTPGGITLLSVLGAGAAAVIINNAGHGSKGSPSAP